jgi:hypothetical protein
VAGRVDGGPPQTGEVDSNKKNTTKLHDPSVNRETNLLSLINPSLAYVYCSN